MKIGLRIFGLFGAVLALLLFIPATRQIGEAAATEPDRQEAVDADATQAPRITRFLVMGVDRAAKLADSMFLVTLNETEKNATILQIPRDTYANYTDGDYKKLNGALHALGERGVKDLLSQALGVPIHYFAVLDLSCLKDLVDAIGGVDLEIPLDMQYSDPAQGLEIDLHAGQNHLNGKEAEQFVRYRSGYVNADLGRLDAQKIFLAAFAKKCCTLTPSQMLRVTCLALTKLQTDIDLPSACRVVSLLRECDADHIPMATLAGQAEQGASGAWYYVVNRAGGTRMANEYLHADPPLTPEQFDPQGLFDRISFKKFHNIYLASEAELPLD